MHKAPTWPKRLTGPLERAAECLHARCTVLNVPAYNDCNETGACGICVPEREIPATTPTLSPSPLTSVIICWTHVVPDLQNVHTKTSSSLDSKVRINSFVASSCPTVVVPKRKEGRKRVQGKWSKLVLLAKSSMCVSSHQLLLMHIPRHIVRHTY